MNKIISYKSEEYINLRFSPEHRKWKKEVLTRDSFTCQKCGSTDKPSAHHIKSFIKYPKYRFDINNGITLCISCHIATESYGAGLIGYMKTKGVKPRWPSAEEMKVVDVAFD